MSRYSAKAHFDSRIEYEQNSGCWLWAGPMSGKYGCVGKLYAHRFSYERDVGPIPEGMDVCHRCDTPLCVNPQHLFPGTRAINLQDAVRKGRMTNRGGKRKSGASHPNARLTLEQVRAIKSDSRSAYKIASEYGVADYTIYCIKKGLTWKDAA